MDCAHPYRLDLLSVVFEFYLNLPDVVRLRIELLQTIDTGIGCICDWRVEEYEVTSPNGLRRRARLRVLNHGNFTVRASQSVEAYFSALNEWTSMNGLESPAAISCLSQLERVYDLCIEDTRYRIEVFSLQGSDGQFTVRVWQEIVVRLTPTFDRRRRSDEVTLADISDEIGVGALTSSGSIDEVVAGLVPKLSAYHAKA
jgi:hypothetical protein